ncbi:MAG: chloride channel protein [Leptospirales bacterium]|nr:chloride channel protein [Leptospirales bacterium]
MDYLNSSLVELFGFLEPDSDTVFYDVLAGILKKQETYLEAKSGTLATIADLRQIYDIEVPDVPSRHKNILALAMALCEKYPDNVKVIPSLSFSVNKKTKIISFEEILEFSVNIDDDAFKELQNERDIRSKDNLLELLSLFRVMNLTRLFKDVSQKAHAMEIVKAAETKNLFMFKQYSYDSEMNFVTEDYCFHKDNLEEVEAGLPLDEIRRIISENSQNLRERLDVLNISDTEFTDYKDVSLNYLLELIIDELAQYPLGDDLLAVRNFVSLRECLLGVDKMAHPLFEISAQIEDDGQYEQTYANIEQNFSADAVQPRPALKKMFTFFSTLFAEKKQGSDEQSENKRSIKSFFNTEIYVYASHVFLSVLLGILAGGCGVLFHYLIEKAGSFFEDNGAWLAGTFTEYYIVGIPIFGALLTATMTYFAPTIAKQKGVVTVIKAILINQGYIPLKETIFHLIAPIISIGTGIPLGPEGPSAKIGGGIGSFMSQTLRLKKGDMMMYTAAGAGAAISAVFNAPIAGVFFGIEVILLNDMRNRALSALIISCVVANIMSKMILPTGGIISIPDYHLGEVYTYPFFIGLAVFCGIIALSYFYLSDIINNVIENVLKITNPYLKLLPAAIIFGFLLLKFPQLYGMGYDVLNNTLRNDVPVMLVGIILVFKLFFVVLFSKAGAYGGSFAPSIVMGAFAGFLFASGVNAVLGINLDPAAYALVGMGGVLSGVNSIPITSILLVFEMTADYKFILPLMLVSMISHLVVLYFKKGTAYSIDLLNTSTSTKGRSDLDILKKTLAKDILRDDIDKVDSQMPLRDAMNVLLRSGYGEIIVVDADDALVGVLSLKDVNLRQVLLDNTIIDKIIAEDIALAVPFAIENEPLHVAIQRMETDKSYIENMPVVAPGGTNRFVGIITHGDIMQAYEKQLNADNTDSFTGNFL